MLAYKSSQSNGRVHHYRKANTERLVGVLCLCLPQPPRLPLSLPLCLIVGLESAVVEQGASFNS